MTETALIVATIRAAVKKKLSPGRYEHTLSVLAMALELSSIYVGPKCAQSEFTWEEKIEIAALFHDFCKDSSKEGNALSHAGAAAELLQSDYGVMDEDILNAVRYHTTGRAGMSMLELIIFLADTLEPGRNYEGVERLRALAYKDLYVCAYETLHELNGMEGFERVADGLEAEAWLEGCVLRAARRNPPLRRNCIDD
jgi:predicted HD superfamily hydrolase involved in NAD metabolism